MACFIVPAAEAVVVKVAEKAHVTLGGKIKWLTNMLSGGAVLLAFEHVWHGEVQPFAPFLTAMESADATAEMLHEMATTGVGMAVAVTAAWGVMCAVATAIEKRADKETVTE